jgi:hypothetical protein
VKLVGTAADNLQMKIDLGRCSNRQRNQQLLPFTSGHPGLKRVTGRCRRPDRQLSSSLAAPSKTGEGHFRHRDQPRAPDSSWSLARTGLWLWQLGRKLRRNQHWILGGGVHYRAVGGDRASLLDLDPHGYRLRVILDAQILVSPASPPWAVTVAAAATW